MFGAPLRKTAGWKQEVQGGLEFKRSDNFFVFGDTSLPGTEVDIVQFRGDWKGERTFDNTTLELFASLVASPGELTAQNGNDEFEAFRPGANPAYVYGRLGATWQDPHTETWSWKLRGNIQLATGALLPTEQLALGGNATVRGYPERILLADSGYALSAELSTPTLSKDLGPLGRSTIRGIAFLDHGLGWREGDGSKSLTGAGLGTRIKLGTFGEGRLDLGRGLDGGDGVNLYTGWFFSF